MVPQSIQFMLGSLLNCQNLGLVLRLRVDFVLPLSQEQEEEEEQPPPKSNKMMKSDTEDQFLFQNRSYVIDNHLFTN